MHLLYSQIQFDFNDERQKLDCRSKGKRQEGGRTVCSCRHFFLPVHFKTPSAQQKPSEAAVKGTSRRGLAIVERVK